MSGKPTSPLSGKIVARRGRLRLVALGPPTLAGLMCFAVATVAYSQPLQHWVLDPKTNCKVWNPHPQPNETVQWTGKCANGLAEGAGMLQWFSNGHPEERDEGQWEGGRQAGRGTQVWSGGRYEGELRDGLPDGHGKLTINDSHYEGEFKGGKPNGRGVLESSRGTFNGTWIEGCLVDEGHKRTVAFGVSLTDCR